MKTRKAILVFLLAFWANNTILLAQDGGFCWVQQGQGSGIIRGNGVTSRVGNTVFIVGGFTNSVKFESTTVNSVGSDDIFIASFDESSGNLNWVKRAGGVSSDAGLAISADPDADEVCITGRFQGTATFGLNEPKQTILTSSGNHDIFIACYDKNSGLLNWAKKAGGSGENTGISIVTNSRVLVTGYFSETATFGPGEANQTQLISAGEFDIFIASYEITTGNLQWAKRAGGVENDRGLGIEERFSDFFVVGEFNLTATFGPGEANKTQLTTRGSRDIFFAKFDSQTGNLIFVKQAGGQESDRARGIVHRSGKLYVTGRFKGSATFDSFTLTSAGGRDIFVAQYDASNGNVLWAKSAGGSDDDEGLDVAETIRFNPDFGGPDAASIHVTGFFNGAATFGKGGPNQRTLTSAGGTDIFIAKYQADGTFRWVKQIGGTGNDFGRGIGLVENDDEGNTETIPSFTVGDFEGSVTFGSKTLTSSGNSDAFLTRLEDFASPRNLDVAEIDFTPYLKLTWDPPNNPLAPTITSVAVDELGSQCSFSNGASGKQFRIRVAFNDPNGDTNTGSIEIGFDSTPTGAQIQKLGSPSNSGNGFTGELSQDVCISFGIETNLMVQIAIKDDAGNLSDYQPVTISNPASGQNSMLYSLLYPQTQVTNVVAGDCGRSVNLLAYRIYRQASPSSQNPEVFIATVPARFTMFRDETPDPNQEFTYRVRALYPGGESEHTGADASSGSPSDDALFDQVENDDPVDEGGRSVGSSWADYNNDGHMDLFVLNFAGISNFLYRNNGNGTFTKINNGAIVNDGGDSYAASWGDYNNDGFMDLFVANSSFFAQGRQNFLYKNTNGNSFMAINSSPIVNEQHDSNNGSWADVDNDGDLDLFVANGSIVSEANALYMNSGSPNFTFTKVTTGAIANEPVISISMHGSLADFDNDGDLDLFVANGGFIANASQNNTLYQNNGNGNFQKVTNTGSYPMIADGGFSTSASWADYDNDGDMDLFVANLKTPADTDGKNFFYKNNGGPNYTFTKFNSGPIVQDPASSRGSSWGDYDNDGDLDLFVVNDDGSNFLYRNNGNDQFSNISQGSLVHNVGSSNASTWADFDKDGYLDLFVANSFTVTNNFLYRNNRARGSNNNNWVNIKCIGNGTGSNIAAIGAKVTVKANINGTSVTQTRFISGQSGGGWGGQNSLNVEFGLAGATQIDELTVEWPSGQMHQQSNINLGNTQQRFMEFTEVATPTTANLSGRVLYVNTSQSPIKNAEVQLGSSTTTSDGSGNYEFQGVPLATYSLTASKTDDWGGVNLFDVLLLIQWAQDLEPLPGGLRERAGNVNGVSGIDIFDVLQLIQRVTDNSDSFVVPDWIFESLPITVSSDLTDVNILGIATGDVNASYVPPTTAILAKEDRSTNTHGMVGLDTKEVMNVQAMQPFELPVRVAKKVELGGLFLKLAYPQDLLHFDGIALYYENKDFVSNVKDGVIRLAWADLTGGEKPMKLNANDTILSLTFKPIAEFDRITLSLESETALADPFAHPIANILKIATIHSARIPTSFELHPNFPNPFNPTTKIRYDLKEHGHVILSIFNILGKEITKLINEEQETGSHEVEWNASNLPSGVYIYQITIKSDSETFTKRRKLLLLK